MFVQLLRRKLSGPSLIYSWNRSRPPSPLSRTRRCRQLEEWRGPGLGQGLWLVVKLLQQGRRLWQPLAAAAPIGTAEGAKDTKGQPARRATLVAEGAGAAAAAGQARGGCGILPAFQAFCWSAGSFFLFKKQAVTNCSPKATNCSPEDRLPELAELDSNFFRCK